MHQLWKLEGISMLACALFFSTGCGSGSANLRLANAIPTQSSLDMLVDGNADASAVAYGSASAYASVGSGSRHIQIEPNGGSTILLDESISLASGSNSTLLVANGSMPVSLLLTDDSTAPATGDFAIRAVNASAGLGTADVYIVPSGTNIQSGSISATASNVAFPSATAYQTLSAGTYQVIFTAPGQKIPLITSSPLSFSAGQVRSLIGLDGQNQGFTTAILSDLN